MSKNHYYSQVGSTSIPPKIANIPERKLYSQVAHNILEGKSYQFSEFVRDASDDSLVWVGIVLFCTALPPSEFGSAQHVPAIPRQLNLHYCAIADNGYSKPIGSPAWMRQWRMLWVAGLESGQTSMGMGRCL